MLISLFAGKVQREEARSQRELEEIEGKKPLARTREDEELNEMQKEQERWDDPMRQFLSVCIE